MENSKFDSGEFSQKIVEGRILSSRWYRLNSLSVAIRNRLNAIVVGFVLFILALAYLVFSILTCPISIGYCQLASPPLGIGLSLASSIVYAYFVLYERTLANWKRRMKGLQKEIESLNEEDRIRLLKVSRKGRETGMLSMGNLFIPTAFLLLGAAATSQMTSNPARIALAASAPMLYVLWLFLVQLSTRLMDDVDSDMRLYAKDGSAQVLHDFYGDRHGFGVMMWVRRNHWLAYVPLLTLGATFIIHSIIFTLH